MVRVISISPLLSKDVVSGDTPPLDPEIGPLSNDVASSSRRLLGREVRSLGYSGEAGTGGGTGDESCDDGLGRLKLIDGVVGVVGVCAVMGVVPLFEIDRSGDTTRRIWALEFTLLSLLYSG